MANVRRPAARGRRAPGFVPRDAGSETAAAEEERVGGRRRRREERLLRRRPRAIGGAIALASRIALAAGRELEGPSYKTGAAWALGNLARNNDANAIAIAAAVGLEGLVQLARRGRVTVDNGHGREFDVVYDAGVPAKRKAALVVAALLRACVLDSVPREIKALIGPYL